MPSEEQKRVERFLDAYNEIDHCLRKLLGVSKGTNFTH
jgi:hypothetical protein